MIEVIDTFYIPNIGSYKPGDHADLGDELEKQLVRAGKARYMLEEVVDPPSRLFAALPDK